MNNWHIGIMIIFFSCFSFNLMGANDKNEKNGKKEKVILGGTEYYPIQMFKEKNRMNGFAQVLTDIFLKDSPIIPQWIEMSNLRQQKELSKKELFCRIQGERFDFYKKIERKKSFIEEYIDKDLKKVKFSTLHSDILFTLFIPGYITVKESRVKDFKNYYDGTVGGYPAINGVKLCNQKDFKTGWNPGADVFPALLVNAGVEKKIFRLETIMDYEYNFFRMIESNRIDFYYDTFGLFTPRSRTSNFLIKKHPELKSLISLRVKDFDTYLIVYLACSSFSQKFINLVNEKNKYYSENLSKYLNFFTSILSKSMEGDSLHNYIENTIKPGYAFTKAYNDGKEAEFLEKMKKQPQ